jgi:hypothetical protein
MKKFTLFLFFVVGLASLQAQDLRSNDSINDVNRTFILKFGVNLVDSKGDHNPFSALSDFDQMAFSNNYNIELEYRFSKWFSLAMVLSHNKWKANEGNIDGIIINTVFVSKNIGEYDKILAPKYFFRIHKKYLINLNYIVNINNADGSNCELVGNLSLPVAKRRKEDLVSFLNIR